MKLGFLVPVAVTAVLVYAFWVYRSNQKARIWASFIEPFKESEYPLRRADTTRESGGWLLDQNRARVHKAWVTANNDGVFVWQFWKRKRYQPFRIEWGEIAGVVFQRFGRSNSWGPDSWGNAELSFRDERTSITIPWREIFEEFMPEAVGYKIHPKYYEQDV